MRRPDEETADKRHQKQKRVAAAVPRSTHHLL